MLTESAPRSYVTGEYLQYQQKYVRDIRESDKALIRWIRDTVENDFPANAELSLLDIGCHSGNLLFHLKNALPRLKYHGGDLFPEILEHCRSNPDLAGIDFHVMDVRNLAHQNQFDFVIVNAVLGRFEIDVFETCIQGIRAAMRSGGRMFIFDWFHPFEQEIFVREKSKDHPDGLPLNFRPFSQIAAILKRQDFTDTEFRPFSIPIDLKKPNDYSNIGTYTIRTDQGERLNFRGSLFQPWCHLRARKN